MTHVKNKLIEKALTVFGGVVFASVIVLIVAVPVNLGWLLSKVILYVVGDCS